ncbi:MAG: hypothetical protein LRZ93_01125 [Clostridiales bacterium]|nr:hypothetical protein [Clostridiales bacterium]
MKRITRTNKKHKRNIFKSIRVVSHTHTNSRRHFKNKETHANMVTITTMF